MLKLYYARPSAYARPVWLALLEKQLPFELRFLENLLGDSYYFAGEQFTLAEIVAGTLVCKMPIFGIPLSDYPRLKVWSERLLLRPTWQQIELSSEEWISFKRQAALMFKLWERRRRQRINCLSQSELQTNI